jgi:putative FmdB family regulatory protein
MPLYEYHCTSCDGAFEVLVRTPAGDARPSCPDCGSREVRRLLSLIASRPAKGADVLPVPSAPRATGGGGCGCGACSCGH